MAELIKLSGLNKSFNSDQPLILKDIDLRFSDGDFTAIIGPSGSGKSTLLSILGLLDSASSGSYLLKGQDVADLSKEQHRELRNSQIG